MSGESAGGRRRILLEEYLRALRVDQTDDPVVDRAPRSDRWPFTPVQRDAALAVTLGAFAVLALRLGWESDAADDAWPYVVAAAAGGALLFRRQQPVAVLLAVVAARFAVGLGADNDLALLPAAVVALYSAARTGDRPMRLALTSVAAIAMALVDATSSDEAFVIEFASELAQGLLPVALADAARMRDERVRELIEREADARVQAERLRIARDLHDVVAHGLSAIAVQSGVAAHLLDKDPEQARSALDAINATGKSSLEELRAMVGVLRSTDEAELTPVPANPNDLDPLLANARHLGLELVVDIHGSFPDHATDSVVVATHRIVQESLTNVARHAGAVPTTVSVRHSDTAVRVEITNDGPTSPPPSPAGGTGVGIEGMRERAVSVGGELRTSSLPNGGFRVEADLPYQRRSAAERS